MVIFKKIADLQKYLSTQTEQKNTIGFVPTMGALHNGHRSLVEKARADGNVVVCSIFVNPTQFNDKSDFEKYPVSIEKDIEILIEAGCDVLFLPSVNEIYPDGTEKVQTFDFGYLDTILEGEKRPGHFRGVGQVVGRLLDIVDPQYLYLGQKDYQQCMVIRRLIEIKGKQPQIQLVICPIIREADGLAMSSRNRRLTEPQRAIACTLYQCLVSIQSKQNSGSFDVARKECIDLLNEKGFVPDYVALADARDLTVLNNYDQNRPMIALVAARIGEIRLIDNLLLN
ncbi:MAG TPA: pantoate--beta-alanine ligase [Flavipsychrobacter sp.]|nr:pantoate--beta-alanine ligase [Flavipsychrobacter sp.]